nr:unnamed protein product [Digitaria exilis]
MWPRATVATVPIPRELARVRRRGGAGAEEPQARASACCVQFLLRECTKRRWQQPVGGERWSLAGATALVTGGSKGIGHAIVEELAGLGARVHTCSRNTAELEESRRRWANKGLVITVSAMSDYSGIMATNLESCFHLSQLAYPLLVNASIAGGGSIVHISSTAGFLGMAGIALYGTTKGAINQLTRSLAAECAHDKIRVNSVAPGLIMTDMSKNLTGRYKDGGQECKRIPLQRSGDAVEVASVVSFLCMPAASPTLPAKSSASMVVELQAPERKIANQNIPQINNIFVFILDLLYMVTNTMGCYDYN